MPDWMKGQESGLENLQMDLLEAPEEEEEEEEEGDAFPIPDVLESEGSETDDSEGDEGGSRMIDLPFSLFDE